MSESGTAPPHSLTVDPEPTEGELAAILSAYQQLWPAESAASADAQESRRWKFSHRWWADERTQRAPVSGWR